MSDIELLTAYLDITVPGFTEYHWEEELQRNGRWGACSMCPRDEQGRRYPEKCPLTERQHDHSRNSTRDGRFYEGKKEIPKSKIILTLLDPSDEDLTNLLLGIPLR